MIENNPMYVKSKTMLKRMNSLINPDDNDRLRPSNPDQLVYTPDSPPAQLGQQDHPLDVVVLQQVDVRPHVGDWADVHHHHVVDLRVLLLVKATRDNHGEAFFFSLSAIRFAQMKNHIVHRNP